MSITRDSFVKNFGQEEANRIEAAAEGHLNDMDDMFPNRGSDPFRWAICICIGFECMSKEEYRKGHGITTPWKELKTWIKEQGDLQNHDGDIDDLAFGAGTYEEFDLNKVVSDKELAETCVSTIMITLEKIAKCNNYD
jgi:hypothetical protein